MKMPDRVRTRRTARSSGGRPEPAVQPDDGLREVGELLAESKGLSDRARTNLKDAEASLAAISTSDRRSDNLTQIDKLLEKSKGLSGQARANLRGVAEDIKAISREAEARQQMSKQS